MYVYVLETVWDTENDSGNDTQVFAEDHLEIAQEVMRENAKEIRSFYDDDVWNDDYTWEDDMSIGLGFLDNMFAATTYTWYIRKLEVK